MSLSDAEWQEITSSVPAAEETTETAEVEEAAAESEETSAAHTPETQEIETDAAPDADAEDAESEETQEDKTTDETDDAEAQAADEFDALDNAIPTAEQIDAKYSRIPKDARGEMVTLADRARTAETVLSEFGDEKMRNTIQPFVPLLSKSQTTEAERFPALKNMLNANYGVTLEIFGDAASFLLADHAAEGVNAEIARGIKEFGNIIVEEKLGADMDTLKGYAKLHADYGDKASPSHIAELLKLEDAGYIDTENDLENFKSTFGGSEVYAQQKQRILDLENEKKEILANPEQFLQSKTVESSTALQDFDTALLTRVDSGITPVMELGKWKPDSTLAKLTKTAILADLKNEPEYREAIKQLRATGVFNAENMVIHTSINNLSNKARGRFRDAVKGINSELRGQSESSLNAQHQKKEPPTKPKAAEMKATTPSYRDPDKELDSIWGEMDAIRSDAAAANGRRVGIR